MLKKGLVSDYNLACPECGAIYYENMRRGAEIIKHELFRHGRVINGPGFVPACPGCGNYDYRRFCIDDLKPRNRKSDGKVICVKTGDLGSCFGGFTHIKIDWDEPDSDTAEKEKLIGGLRSVKEHWHYKPVWIYANFPEHNNAVHFRMSHDMDPMETISVFGRVSMEDARVFVKELLEIVNQ